MRFGMLHLFENPVGKTEHQIIHEQMELMRAFTIHSSTFRACTPWSGLTAAPSTVPLKKSGFVPVISDATREGKKENKDGIWDLLDGHRGSEALE